MPSNEYIPTICFSFSFAFDVDVDVGVDVVVLAEPKKMTLKMPKELEMPKMKDHQMFDRARIVELQDELQDNFKALKVSGMGAGLSGRSWFG